MRTRLFFSLLLPVLLSGCILLDDGITGTRPRSDNLRDGRTDPDRRHPADSLPAPAAAADTILYYSAVRFPADYDWQRDTAYGAVPFELLLYRDGSPVLTLPSGPDAPFGPDPDRHHIHAGHLYTERMLGGQTLIGRDGEEVLRLEEREFLLGLLESGPDLYTLTRPVSGKGFRYRRNDQLLIERAEGTPYGTLSDPSYGSSGALYLDDGKVCFCYWEGNAYNRSHYLIRDGESTRMSNILPSQTVLDLKLHGGRAVTLTNAVLKNRLSEGRIWPEGNSYAVTGRFTDESGDPCSGFLEAASWSVLHRLCDEEAVLYHTPQAVFAVSAAKDGAVRWYGPDLSGQSDGPCYFFSPACATAAGSRLYLALTPKDTKRRPLIRAGEREQELDLWGYVSCVAVELIPPAN